MALPATYQGGLDAPLNALNGLNKLEAANATDSDSAIEAWGSYLALIEDLDPEIAAAGVRRLASLGKGKAAARLAIAHWVHAPQLVNEIQEDIDAFSRRIAGSTHPARRFLNDPWSRRRSWPSLCRLRLSSQRQRGGVRPGACGADAALDGVERCTHDPARRRGPPRTGVAPERERRL